MNQHVIESVNVCIPDSKDLVDKSLSHDEGMVYSEALENSMEKLGSVVSDFDQFSLEVSLEGSPEKSWELTCKQDQKNISLQNRQKIHPSQTPVFVHLLPQLM